MKAANSPGFFLPGLKSYLIVSIGDNTPKQDSSQKHHRKKDAEQADPVHGLKERHQGENKCKDGTQAN